MHGGRGEDLMKKPICLLSLLLVCGIVSGQEKMKIGYFYLEPFIIEKAGTIDPVGVSVDYWEKLVAPKMGVTIEWIGPLPIARMYQYLDTGEIDAIFFVVKNPDREKKYLFASRPYCTSHASLWVLKESPLKVVKTVSDVSNWKIGFVEGSVINPFLVNESITIENAQGDDYKQINFNKLFANRLDAIYDHNEYTLAYEATRLNIRSRLRVVFLPVDPVFPYAAFSNTERGARFLRLYEPVNNALPATAVSRIIRSYTGD